MHRVLLSCLVQLPTQAPIRARPMWPLPASVLFLLLLLLTSLLPVPAPCCSPVQKSSLLHAAALCCQTGARRGFIPFQMAEKQRSRAAGQALGCPRCLPSKQFRSFPTITCPAPLVLSHGFPARTGNRGPVTPVLPAGAGSGFPLPFPAIWTWGRVAGDHLTSQPNARYWRS